MKRGKDTHEEHTVGEKKREFRLNFPLIIIMEEETNAQAVEYWKRTEYRAARIRSEANEEQKRAQKTGLFL